MNTNTMSQQQEERKFSPEIHSVCGLAVKRPGFGKDQYKCPLKTIVQAHVEKCRTIGELCHCNDDSLRWNHVLQKYEGVVVSRSPPMPAMSLPNSILGSVPVHAPVVSAVPTQNTNFPQDIGALYRELGSLQTQVSMLTTENENLKKDNSYMKEKIGKLYGKINFLKSKPGNNDNAAHKTVARPDSNKPIKKVYPPAQGAKKPFRKNFNKPGVDSSNESPKTD